jgi:hypothetical protein
MGDGEGSYMKWRIARNKWNMRASPWHGAVGIEEDDDSFDVPALICWFMRGVDLADIQQVVDSHNKRK